jgi:short-subunit dehydrogenase
MTELKNKVILITGATGGMGQEMVSAFLNECGHLILTDIIYEDLEIFVNSILDPKGKILGYFASDISTESGCNEVFEKTAKISPYIDILVNNAGIAVIGSYINVPDERWEEVISVNLLAPMRLTKKFLSGMLERKTGHIVNMISITGFLGVGALVAYSASKFALSGFGEAIYNDVSDYGIQITNIYPSFTRTKILHSEQYGYEETKYVPDLLIGEPRFVIKKLIKGIKKNKLYVYPGLIAKTLHLLKRSSPGFFLFLAKLYRQSKSRKEKQNIKI